MEWIPEKYWKKYLKLQFNMHGVGCCRDYAIDSKTNQRFASLHRGFWEG